MEPLTANHGGDFNARSNEDEQHNVCWADSSKVVLEDRTVAGRSYDILHSPGFILHLIELLLCLYALDLFVVGVA